MPKIHVNNRKEGAVINRVSNRIIKMTRQHSSMDLVMMRRHQPQRVNHAVMVAGGLVKV